MTNGDPHSHLGSVASIIGLFDQLLVLTLPSWTPVRETPIRRTGQIIHVNQQNRSDLVELPGPLCAV
jgi:hypothetical protein